MSKREVERKEKQGYLTNALGVVLDIATGQFIKGCMVRLGPGGQELALNGLCFGGKSSGHGGSGVVMAGGGSSSDLLVIVDAVDAVDAVIAVVAVDGGGDGSCG